MLSREATPVFNTLRPALSLDSAVCGVGVVCVPAARAAANTRSVSDITGPLPCPLLSTTALQFALRKFQFCASVAEAGPKKRWRSKLAETGSLGRRERGREVRITRVWRTSVSVLALGLAFALCAWPLLRTASSRAITSICPFLSLQQRRKPIVGAGQRQSAGVIRDHHAVPAQSSVHETEDAGVWVIVRWSFAF